MDVASLDTPVATVDLDAVQRNILRMQGYCDEHGLAFRPHIKTHKLPAVAHMQMRAGAVGITCQKLGEAEVVEAAGLRDILFYALSEEHRHVDFSASPTRPEVGEVVTVVPNHACGCANLHDEVVVHRGGRFVGLWPVAARGKLR